MSTSVDDETILDVLRDNDAPRMTTTEVAEELPVTRGTTRSRLQRLVDDDRLERTREGNNVVWWLPDRAGELETAAAQSEDEDAGDGDDAADGESTAEEDGDEDADESSTTDETEEAEDEGADDEEAEDDDDATADEETEDATADEGDDDATADIDDGVAEIEVTPTGEPDDDGPTTVEVEAVGDDESPDAPFGETVADDDDAEPELPELSDDEEGLRALAVVAAGLVLLLLVRRLFSGDDEA